MKLKSNPHRLGEYMLFLLDIIFFFAVAGLELSKLPIGQPCRWLYGFCFEAFRSE